jgi:hypothetical protein
VKALVFVSSAAVGLACTDVSTTRTTAADFGGDAVPMEEAVSAITRAQCSRAEACGAVPQRGIYRSADYCDADLRRETHDDLFSGASCDYVDTARLAVCVEAIRQASCADLDVTRERAPSTCRREELCRQKP